MSVVAHPSPPTSSLPPLRSLAALSRADITAALKNLQTLYCPLPKLADFQLNIGLNSQPWQNHGLPPALPLTSLDSGYGSEADHDNHHGDGAPLRTPTNADRLDALRADPYERAFATRWLTGFVARAEAAELADADDDARQALVDEACTVLAALSDEVVPGSDDEGWIERSFTFTVCREARAPGPAGDVPATRLGVVLHDGPAHAGSDHTDVGLQTWGASVVLAEMLCADPARFGLLGAERGPRVVELGAGTGLLSLAVAALLARLRAAAPATIVATDFHPAVLANLRRNLAANRAPHVRACRLDWAAPALEPPLDVPADLLVAADVVYAPEHAVWLRDCAARMLAPDGVFWLMASVRPNGRFGGLSGAVRAVFAQDDGLRGDDGRRLRVVAMDKVDKRKGVGRADESGYELFKITWQ